MVDKILTKKEIFELAEKVIKNFEPSCVQPASYDVRAGDIAIFAHPDGHKYISLKHQKEITIHPFESVVVYSYESINLPRNMEGYVWIRSYFANKGLSFSGGSIDPGYKGILFLSVRNVGPGDITVKYQEPLVSAKFTKLSTPTVSYSKEEFLEIPQQRLPLLPSRSMYDWAEISEKLDKLNESLKKLEFESKYTRRILEIFVMAVIIGLVVALVEVLLTRVL